MSLKLQETMRRYESALLMLSMIVLTLLLAPSLVGDDTVWEKTPNYISLLSLGKLRTFLEKQYVPQAGLLRAATMVSPDNTTIYVANDNVLAARALAVLGSPLAEKVMSVLYNNFSGGWNGKIDVLLCKSIPDKFYKPEKEVVGRIDGYIIAYEKMNTSVVITDWYDYADLLVYHALNKLLQGSRAEAEKAFLNLTRMWDGYGFKDNFVKEHGVYQVYKCALFIYLYRALEDAGSTIIYGYQDIYEKCLEIIAKAQDPVKGGIHTDYRVVNGKIVIQGDMNTETTSIVVLALYSNYPEWICFNAIRREDNMFFFPEIIIVAITLVLLSIICFREKNSG